MEIAGYPIAGWLAAIAFLALPGWITARLLIWIWLAVTENQPSGPEPWLVRNSWLLTAVFTVGYGVLLYTAALGRS